MSEQPGPTAEVDVRSRLARWMIVIAWLVFLALLTMLFSTWLERQSNPNRELRVTADSSREPSLMLQRNRAGHYLAPGEIDGVQVTFLIDTGATRVAMPEALAQRIGLSGQLLAQSQTASGVVDSWLTTIDTLRLGPLEMHDVPAVIIPDMPGNEVLLGMSFLKHLKLEQQGDRLKIGLPD